MTKPYGSAMNNPKGSFITNSAALSKLKDKLWEEKSKGVTDIQMEQQGLPQTLSHGS